MTCCIAVLLSASAVLRSSRVMPTPTSKASWSGTTETWPTPCTVTVRVSGEVSSLARAGLLPASPNRYAATMARATRPATSSVRTLSVTFLSITTSAVRSCRSDVRQAVGVPAIFSRAIR